MGELAELCKARGEIDAELITGALEQEGIDAIVVRTGEMSPGAWMYVGHDPFIPLTIMVPAAALEDARRILAEQSPDDLDEMDVEEAVAEGETSLVPLVVVGIVVGVLLAAFFLGQIDELLTFL